MAKLAELELKQQQVEAPTTPEERMLSSIWAEVLHVNEGEIGVRSTFFQLGGDSISVIALVALCRRQGLTVTTADVYSFPTIEGLAKKLDFSTMNNVNKDLVFGDVKLTPFQKWFLERPGFVHSHFNQSVLLTAKQPLDGDILGGVVTALINQHDMLRAKFYESVTGGWTATIMPSSDDPFPVITVDVDDFDIEEHIQSVQTTLDLAAGRLIAVALFDMGTEQRVFIAIHQLVVDLPSWDILMEDLGTLLNGKELPDKTDSFRRWVDLASAHSTTGNAEELTQVLELDSRDPAECFM